MSDRRLDLKMSLTPNDGSLTPRDRLIQAFERRGGVLTRRDIAGLGFGSDTLQQLLKAGKLVRAAQTFIGSPMWPPLAPPPLRKLAWPFLRA
jgi:hypothetical protein